MIYNLIFRNQWLEVMPKKLRIDIPKLLNIIYYIFNNIIELSTFGTA